jgi:hypothetical protein
MAVVLIQVAIWVKVAGLVSGGLLVTLLIGLLGGLGGSGSLTRKNYEDVLLSVSLSFQWDCFLIRFLSMAFRGFFGLACDTCILEDRPLMRGVQTPFGLFWFGEDDTQSAYHSRQDF